MSRVSGGGAGRALCVEWCPSKRILPIGCYTTADATAPHPSGVLFLGDAHLWSPHVATTPRGEIRGYARLPPPAGVAEMSAFGHRLCRWRRGGLCAAPDHSATGVYLWHTLYMYRVIPAQLRKCRAMGRHATLLLSLWRSDLAVVRGSDQRG